MTRQIKIARNGKNGSQPTMSTPDHTPIAPAESYTINNEPDIQFILRGIMQAKSLITLYFNQGNSFILTSILAIDPKNKKMILDYGNDEKLNQKVLNTAKITCVTSQAKVKVEFKCNSIKKIQFQDDSAFIVNLPESLIRMQRRDFFRISTPSVKPLICILPLPAEYKSKKAEVVLLDISCGGIAVIDQHPIVSFDPGTIFKNCQISLPEIGTITTDIQVKNTYEVTLHNEVTCKRAGCEFIKPPTKILAMIQRYIVKLEQKHRLD